VARFFGRYEHSLDPKGRVILPSKFRAPFDHGGYLTNYSERCLALWTPEDFELQMQQMQEQQELGREERNLARLWAAGTSEVEIDKQGRMANPPYLREFARLEGDVLVIGLMNRVELWNPQEWDRKVQRAAEAELTGEEDEA
jgi:MraZ protein